MRRFAAPLYTARTGTEREGDTRQIADLLRGPHRPPQYECVMLPMTVLRRFDCVLAPTKARVLVEHTKRKGGKLEGDALDSKLNEAAGQRFHNHSPLDFASLPPLVWSESCSCHAQAALAKQWERSNDEHAKRNR